jgi:hypothetical protein
MKTQSGQEMYSLYQPWKDSGKAKGYVSSARAEEFLPISTPIIGKDSLSSI